MRTIKLSNPPYWWVLLWAAGPLMTQLFIAGAVPPPQFGGPGAVVSVVYAIVGIAVWFTASFLRQTLHNITLSFRRYRKHRQEGRDLATFAGDYPILTQEATPPKKRAYDDPGGLVPSWLAVCCVMKTGAVTPIDEARASFKQYVDKQVREGNPHVPPENNHWLPGRLRELGYDVRYAPKIKGDPNSKPGRAVYDLKIK